ncbi:MAG: DUF1922 domain-containing protein [Candidatus Bathyarchaeota archaeon]|nr:MAG: DUF1922 domain-containing protein [Candidatus Bathyarchaeota archaeon]
MCSRCGQFLIAGEKNKSRRCFYCGERVVVSRAKRVGRAETSREASALAQHLKLERAKRKTG